MYAMRKGVLTLVCFCCAGMATMPNQATRRWWSYTEALGNDNMQGRETGSAGYRRAEAYVIQKFKEAGLSPGGTDGFKQAVPLQSLRLQAARSPVKIDREAGSVNIAWFRELTLAVRPNLPQKIDAPLYFLGDGSKADAAKVKGAVVVTLGAPRIRPSGSAAPVKVPEGAAATVSIDSLGGPEPPIWPLPYAGVMSLADAGAERGPAVPAAPAFRWNPEAAETLFAGSGHSYLELKKSLDAGQPLPNFSLAGRWEATLTVEESKFSSDNIVAVLPGSNADLKNEYVVLSAHLDGYGIGEARHGDSIYNGAFDDAAYVALLMDLAQSLHESHAALKRSLLFCIVTGEEKGLLGSKYFAAHPTIPKQQMVADLNLDQVRAIFPLKLLTTLALKESSLGDVVKQVAEPLGIRIQEDPEPERNLLRRSDHFSFMQIGVPAVNFVFGYEKGSPEEKVYRQWYAQRYHSPADDLQQPWVPEAAAKFNLFYTNLVKAVADLPERPHWSVESHFAPHSSE